MRHNVQESLVIESHPMWVRGLKHCRELLVDGWGGVAPYVGAWIETSCSSISIRQPTGRTLCGCVD